MLNYTSASLLNIQHYLFIWMSDLADNKMERNIDQFFFLLCLSYLAQSSTMSLFGRISNDKTDTTWGIYLFNFLVIPMLYRSDWMIKSYTRSLYDGSWQVSRRLCLISCNSCILFKGADDQYRTYRTTPLI